MSCFDELRSQVCIIGATLCCPFALVLVISFDLAFSQVPKLKICCFSFDKNQWRLYNNLVGENIMVWLYISIIMCMRVVQSVFSKKNATSLNKNAICYVKYTAYFQGVAGFFALGLFVVELIIGTTVSGVGETILYSVLSGLALALSCICGIYILCQGTMALSSLFGTAGLIVPTVASIFLYDEFVSWYQWVAIAVFMVGAFFLAGGSKKIYGKFTITQLAVLVCSLLLGGTTMLMQKMFGMNVQGGNVSLFSLISFGSSALLFAAVIPVLQLCNKKVMPSNETHEKFTLFPPTKEQAKLNKNSYLYGLFLAMAVFLINQLSTLSTPLIEAVVLFAIICGGATIISTLVGAVLYKEKITWRTVVGLILGIGSLVLLKI